MKEAYLSFVLYDLQDFITADEIKFLDSNLANLSRHHEVILVTNKSKNIIDFNSIDLKGAITILSVLPGANENAIRISALARSSGDFIIEWLDNPNSLDNEEMSRALALTGSGVELIDFVSVSGKRTDNQLNLRVINSFRQKNPPLQNSFARLISRRALAQALQHMITPVNPDVCLSDLIFKRENIYSSRGNSPKAVKKWGIRKSFSTLILSTRFGTIFPVIMSGISAAFALGMAIFATTLFLIEGKSPEGWTTLMIVNGLGVSSILALLGMVWVKLESIFKALTSSVDVTSEVNVVSPRLV
jgi:hypothetical protein